MAESSNAPSNYGQLKQIRASKTAKLKACKYLRPSTELRYYQVIGSLSMLLLNRMLLGDAAGLGKTIQTIAMYAVLLEKDPTIKLLVVTTKSAIEQWQEEFEKFSTGIGTHILSNKYKPKGAKRQLTAFKAREAQYEDMKDVNVLITGYHSVKEEFSFLVQNRGDNFIVVFDECQEFKNQKTKAFAGAEKVSQNAVRTYGLSATPIKNRLVEFYWILRVLVPGLFPGVTKFKDRYTIQKLVPIPVRGGGRRMIKEVVGYKNIDEFRAEIDPFFLNRRTEDVANELPSLISKKVAIEMTPTQKKVYADALSGVIYKKRLKQKYYEHRDLMEALTRDPTEKEAERMELLTMRYEESMSEDTLTSNKMAALAYCQLVANGPEWVEERGESAKETEFRRVMDGDLVDRKVIVYTRFKSGIKRLEAILEDLDLQYVRVTGDENDKQRANARKQFQDKESGVNIIFITAAGSAAINLQSAGAIMFYDTPWSFGDFYQTIGRARRIGSEHEVVLLIHMVCINTIDEHVLKVLEGKKELTDQVLGNIAEGSLEFGKDRIEFDREENEIDALFTSVFK